MHPLSDSRLPCHYLRQLRGWAVILSLYGRRHDPRDCKVCTVKCVHCQVCSQVLCAVDAGAAKRSAPIGQCQCHGLDAGAAKGTDAVAAKGFAPWDPLPDAKAGSEPVTCFSEIVASCLPKLWGLLAGPRLVLLFITKEGRTKPMRTVIRTCCYCFK